MPRNKRFTVTEIDFIRLNYNSMTIKEISDELDRTEKAVRAKIERLKISLKDLPRNKPSVWSKDQLKILQGNYENTSDYRLSEILGISESKITRKRLENGYRKHKYAPYLESEYFRTYVDGKRVWLHRHIVENALGRELLESEKVHHIDGDKQNNDPINLYVCENRQEHGQVHDNLEKIAFELFKLGTIKFNSVNGKYYL
jgi:uncharacterized protein YktA (UPF0223 family)